MEIIKNPGESTVSIAMDNSEFATAMARRICTVWVPEWMKTFIAKNRKYRKVDNHLGARGVFPDVNRKVGILEARVWDGDEPSDGAESTVEVIDDLIGHLFLMRDMLIQEGTGEQPWDGSIGRLVTPLEMEEPLQPGGQPHQHYLDDLQNCARPGCNYAHAGAPMERAQTNCDSRCDARQVHWHEWRAPNSATVIHPGHAPRGTRWVDAQGNFIAQSEAFMHTRDLLPLPRPIWDQPQA